MSVDWFYTDADLVGAGEFGEDEGELALATEFTVPAGTYQFRWRRPAATVEVTPTIRVWDNDGNLVGGPFGFATAVADSWVVTSATLALLAGTYRIAVNTDAYVAKGGFFTGGSVTRDGVTGVRALFGTSPTSRPSTASTSTYFIDMGLVTDDPDPEPEPEPGLEAVADVAQAGAAMHLARVMDEMALVLGGITGLKKVYPYPPPTLSPPSAYVSYPARVAYDLTYQRGEDDYESIPVVVVAGRPTEKRVRDLLAAWSASDGPNSVKALLESREWTSCDDVRVPSAEFDIETIAGIDYLAVVFTANAVGPGRE
jgi:hypothetical protein